MVKWISVKIVVGKAPDECGRSACPHFRQAPTRDAVVETCELFKRDMAGRTRRCDECWGSKEL